MIGQRVKFADPDPAAFDARVGQAPELRGRVAHVLGTTAQVLVDGRTFAVWVATADLVDERAVAWR